MAGPGVGSGGGEKWSAPGQTSGYNGQDLPKDWTWDEA